jgi:glycine dehydrogenase
LAASLSSLEQGLPFADRHVGPGPGELRHILDVVGVTSLDELAEKAVPASLRASASPPELPPPVTEAQALAELRALAARNRPMIQMIGLGHHDTVTPPVLRRTILENPAWHTACTPCRPETSQGRLEALLTFQTAIADLTGLPIVNAALFDEATAAAEAMTLVRRAGKSASNRFVVDEDTLPHTLAVLRTRAEPLGIELVVEDLSQGLTGLGLGGDFFGVLLSCPGASGAVREPDLTIADAKRHGAAVIVAADPLSLTLLRPPGERGADVAVGSTQRFGVPLGFGGRHAAYLAVRPGLERQLPGHLVGVSTDAGGAPAYRPAPRTREQHIRREKATSNICTAQVLPAVLASMYAVHHGPGGLRGIALRAHRMATVLAAGLAEGGVDVVHGEFFDTITVAVPDGADAVVAAARDLGVNLRRIDDGHVGVACDETTTRERITLVWQAFGVSVSDVDGLDEDTADALPAPLRRTSEFLTHPVFHAHRSETALLRYLRELSDKDVAPGRGMVLGSGTMKLAATAEREPVTWPEFAGLHPFAPAGDAAGLLAVEADLESWLARITGYDEVSRQPDAGGQGEFAGLLAIRAHHRSRGEHRRDVCLIPAGAHGTNAASAVMAGMRVVVVRCGDDGAIDLAHLRSTVDEHGDDLAAVMLTCPSTRGIHEDTVGEVCALVHDAGGQVYVDGADLDALTGLARYGRFGADVAQLDLHETFCVPHGGGPGAVGVRAHLAPFLPNHPPQPATGVGPAGAAPWGSASILPVSWAYVRMMGAGGLRRARLVAVAAANYVARRLGEHYPVLYTGRGGFVAHECVLDLRPLTKETGVTADDVAKRLVDYGLHAPTMSTPVPGTLTAEPTGSENLAELDRFCAAMIAIRGEIDRVATGEWPLAESPLRHAPHTARCVTGEWNRPYSRETAVFPAGPAAAKVWPPVRRVDGAAGDRDPACSCPPPEAFAQVRVRAGCTGPGR